MRVDATAPVLPAFESQSSLIDAEFELVCARIRFVLAARDRSANSDALGLFGWPAELQLAEQRLRDRAKEIVDFPITRLRVKLGLDDAELRVVWLLLAHEMCALTRDLLRDLNTESCADPTTATVRLAAFGLGHHADAIRLLASNSRLVTGGLIERTDKDAGISEHRGTWKAARRIVALAHGDLSPDPQIAPLLRGAATVLGIAGQGIEADPAVLPTLVDALRGEGHSRALIVQGPRGTGRSALLRLAANECGLNVLEVDLQHFARGAEDARAQALAIARECRLFARVPLLRDLDALESASEPGAMNDRIEHVLGALDGLRVLATTTKLIAGNRLRGAQIVEPRPLTGDQRAWLWKRALPASTDDDADRLATMYPISPALIAAAASHVTAHTAREATHLAIRTGLRVTLDGRLSGLAHRVDTAQDWNMLVLPNDQCNAITELIARIRQRRKVYETWGLGSATGRGLGVSALFSGPPGTGKTMCASLIAEELRVDLYQVDMSKIVSKWIGETERNLAALFDAAEAGHAILLFDEADALFGRRTDVRTSNDRHANQETNYLLQRLESFRGICVLTTNNDTAIDVAFRRRIAVHVQFPMPEIAERTLLWRSMIRDTVPVHGALDFAGLAARYEMSGGHIRNAVLRAAFLAADADSSVTNQHLSLAAHIEYQAMGRIATSL